MSGAEQALATLRDYVERSTHWQEGGATRHDALKVALPKLEAALRELDGDAEPVGSISKSHLTLQQQEPWCREVLLYSPSNQGDDPGKRVMLYTAGRLDDALEWAEKGVREWRHVAQEKTRHLASCQATARIAIEHLRAVVQTGPVPVEDFNARCRALDWLTSIGSDPN